ncbi:MAG: amino acid adenylation domain-containing protein [Pseudomonadota bacterium]
MKDWQGPASVIDTACSSSLVAIHHACRSLRDGSSKVALAGGAKLLVYPPDADTGFAIDSSTARTRAFDAEADGTGVGEGSAIFVLKPLSAATEDGDHIHAVIRGSAVNQDGASSGASAPNPAMQAEVIRQAASSADIDLSSLSYFEAHGTGTSLGDPIEIDGLARALEGSDRMPGATFIGSGKGNYGHLDGAAGALGLARAILALRHDHAPPQPYFESPNPKIDFERASVRVPKRLEKLPDRGQERRAGVSSFGLSGINAHLVVEAPPVVAGTGDAPGDASVIYVVALSAGSDAALRDYARKLHHRIRGDSSLTLRDIAFTLATGRDGLKHRFATAVQTREELLTQLAELGAGVRQASLANNPGAEEAIAACADTAAEAQEHVLRYLDGAPLSWPDSRKAQRQSLPSAPFVKKACKPDFKAGAQTATSLLQGPLETATAQSFSIAIGDPAFWPVSEHRLNDHPTLVGMAVPALMARAIQQLDADHRPVQIADLTWHHPLVESAVPDGKVTLSIFNDGQVEMAGRLKNGKWRVFASAKWDRNSPVAAGNGPDLASVRASATVLVPLEDFTGQYGPVALSDRWNCNLSLHCNPEKTSAIKHLRLDGRYHADLEDWLFHPALADSACSIALVDEPLGALPSAVDQITVHGQAGAELFACGQRRASGKFDVTLFDTDSHAPVLTLAGIRFDRAGSADKPGSPEPLKTQWQSTPVTPQDIPAGCLFITDGDFWPVPATCQRLHPDDLDRTSLSAVSHAVLALQPGSDSAARTAEALRAILRNMNGGLRLVTLGCGGFQLDGDAVAISPDQTGAAGVVLAVAHEEPRLGISYADMAPEAIQDCLGAELSLKPSQDPVSVYRNGQRSVRRLLPLEDADRGSAARWPDHGVCIVTGGTGGFAMALAEEMAVGGKLHLALLGRRDETALDEETLRELERLRDKGIELSLFSCDVADSAALGETLDRVRVELGPITAVVHAAGIADGGFLALRDRAQFDEVLSAKVTGAVNLDQLTRDDPLQAFVMFGSLTAIVGAPGQTAYCAANAFLDGFAQYRRAQGLPALTIDWCALSDQGMGARNNVTLHEGAWVRPTEAVKLWQTALGSSAAQLTMLDPSLLQGAAEAAHESGSHAVSSETAPSAAVERDVKGRIATIWAETLGYDSVDWDDDFFALGGDSISGMQIIDQINSELSLSLTLSDLFTESTVSALAALAARERGGADKEEGAAAESSEAGGGQAIDLERALSAIWAEALGYDAVAPEDDFYALGGDSITGMQITDRIANELGYEISLTDLFEHSSVAELREKLSMQSVGRSATGEEIPADAKEAPAAPLANAREAQREERDPRRAPDLPYYPLALEQLSVMNAAQKGNMETAFNLPHAFVLDEAFDIDRLRASIRALTERHEILRTRIIPEGDTWQMDILPAARAMRDLPVDPVREPIEDACPTLVEPFDLENEIPVRWRIPSDPSGKTALFFDIHHILADGFTVERLLGELFALYWGEELAPLRYQLRDYAWWSHKEENRERLAAAESYWQSLYADSLPKLDLPSDRRRPAYHTFKGEISGFELDPSLLAEARSFAADQRVTMFTLVLSTWFLVLSRLAETEDLVISVPVDGRDAAGFNDVAGMMVSLLPLRMQVNGTQTVKDLLARMQDHHVHALRHRAYFLDQLLEDLSPPAAPDRTLLSEVTLSYMNYHMANPQSDKGDAVPPVISIDRHHSKNDIGIFVRDLPERMAITFDYYADLFDRARIEQLGQVFSTTLQRLIRSDAQQVGSIDLLPDDQSGLLRDWENGPRPNVPQETSLFALFAANARSSPERCAVRDATGSWTYSQLMAEARAVARHLTEAGVKQGDFVALHIERGRQAVAATLGIAAIGAGYVPLDPAYPAERNRFILQDSGASIVLVDDEGQAALADTVEQVAQVWQIADIPSDDGGFELPVLKDPQTAPAYLMYTSGSTGTPKGVLIEQGALLRLAVGEDYAGIAPGDVVAQAGPLSFDAATFEIWTTLLRGAEVAVIDRHTLLDPAAFGAALSRFAVSKMFMSVGLFNRQVDHDPTSLSGLKVLMIGGDSISKSHARTFMDSCPDTRLMNGYGPTESTTFAVVTPILPSDLSEETECTIIGRPIAYTRTVIRDGRGLRAPIGVWGELQIGGERLAREYWRQPELTAERFVPDPDRPGARLYRTGDLARWTRNGRIEFGGRRDNQIKLRGFRIELDEIEHQLRQAPSAKNAVALFSRDGVNGGEIIACIQRGDEADAISDSDLGSLQAWLGQRLPAYMLPTKWYLIDDIPITENGKVDRKTLLDRVLNQVPVDTQGAGADTTPLTPTERLVADVFSEVFETEINGRDASFAVLGGHSLMAIRIVNRLADRSGKRISMADFFANPTVAALARHIDGLDEAGTAGESGIIPKAPLMDDYPASHAQKRLYLLSQMDANSGAYGMLFALRCSGLLDPDVLQAALRQLVDRHEPLRTAFNEHDGVITQRIHPTTPPDVAFTDVSDMADPAREALRLTREEAATPVALDRPPLIRARLIKVGPDEHLLVLITHHIVGDGWSSRILLRELGALYQAAVRDEEPALAPLPITYKDFAHWQAEQDWSEAADYWREKLKGAPEQIALPTDRRAPEIQSYRGAHAHLMLDPDVLRGLHALARTHNTTLSAVGLALFSVLLYRLTRQDDMVIGMGVAGREKTETEGLIGFFVNVLPIRVQLDAETDLDALIDAVHQNITGALDRQDYPFDALVRAVAPKRNSNRQPLVNVVFEYQRFEALARVDDDTELPVLRNDQEGFLPRNLDSFVDNTTAKHDLILFLTEEADQARFTLEYDTDLFDAETMQRWLTFLNKFASAAAENSRKDS